MSLVPDEKPCGSDFACESADSQAPFFSLEKAGLTHTGVLLVFAAWAFDGNTPWARTLISWWGCAGAFLTLLAAYRGRWRSLYWLWPLLPFNALVLASCLNPSFSTRLFGGEPMLVHTGGIAWLPSSADPAASLRALCLFDGIFISCFNIRLLIRRRRALRGLLILMAVNALALSIFGTIQKLMGAGLFFGLRKSPNAFFFATFVYHNHWAAFAILAVTVCAGLIFYYSGREQYRDFWHSPASAGTVGMLFIAMSAPLSESRSGTLLVTLLLAAMLAHALARWYKKNRTPSASLAWLAIGAAALAGILALFIYKLDTRDLNIRADLTHQQLEQMVAQGGLGSRATLYSDTWHMAREHLWFGWGFDSYASVFRLFNTQKSVDRLPVFYAQAHSDWLQMTAETGIIGTALVGLLGALPLLKLRWQQLRNPIVLYPLIGCAVLLTYAWVEFPFECPTVAIAFWMNFFVAVRYAQLSPAGDDSR